jgi:UDP-glucose 4-epimerase
VRGTLVLLEGMKAAGIRRLVYSSSAATYGEVTVLPVAEDASQEPDSPYGVSKLAAEKYALCYGRLNSWSVLCLRYFNVYGERQRFDAYGNVIPIFASRLKARLPLVVFGDGLQTRDFVNVADVARANLDALETEVGGCLNIATGVPTTIIDLALSMRAIAGVDVEITHVAPRPGEVLRSSARIVSAREVLGYAPAVSLDEGLAAYWSWFEREGGGVA